MSEKQQFIKIQSTMNITVTAGLQGLDVTNADAHVPDRLKVQSLWPKLTVDIHEGVGSYPAYIKDWNTVKALVRDKVLTIGEVVESEITEDEKAKKAALDENMKEVDNALGKKDKKNKDVKLEDIAGE